jgi:hypothetical protein
VQEMVARALQVFAGSERIRPLQENKSNYYPSALQRAKVSAVRTLTGLSSFRAVCLRRRAKPSGRRTVRCIRSLTQWRAGSFRSLTSSSARSREAMNHPWGRPGPRRVCPQGPTSLSPSTRGVEVTPVTSSGPLPPALRVPSLPPRPSTSASGEALC